MFALLFTAYPLLLPCSSRQGYDVGDLPDDSRALMERILNDPEAR